VRVSIGGNRVIDDWSVHAERTTTALIHLQAGMATPIEVDYFQAGGQATLYLGLQRADGTNELASQITNNPNAGEATSVTKLGTGLWILSAANNNSRVREMGGRLAFRA